VYITPSKKKYLTAIKKLQNTETELKAVSLAHTLNVSKPSVSIMLRQLEKDGLICPYKDESCHVLRLTDAGENIVRQIETHCLVLEKMFCSFGAPAAVAEKDAASVEPYLSEEMYSVFRCR
jgi:DtxR family transcriptional regulator, Mn-dependent transcriptional regulator